MQAHTELHQALSPETVQAQRASVAIGVAPLLVLLAFVAVVAGLIEPDIGVSVFAACTAWVVYELYRYQDRLDVEAEQQIKLPATDPALRVRQRTAPSGGSER